MTSGIGARLRLPFRAIEEKRFLPLGSDREAESDFHLICGTNRDLATAVEAGRFREDLLARIDLWSFRMSGLADRREDIESNLDYELEKWASRTGKRLSFNKEASTTPLGGVRADCAISLSHPPLSFGLTLRGGM